MRAVLQFWADRSWRFLIDRCGYAMPKMVAIEEGDDHVGEVFCRLVLCLVVGAIVGAEFQLNCLQAERGVAAVGTDDVATSESSLFFSIQRDGEDRPTSLLKHAEEALRACVSFDTEGIDQPLDGAPILGSAIDEIATGSLAVDIDQEATREPPSNLLGISRQSVMVSLVERFDSSRFDGYVDRSVEIDILAMHRGNNLERLGLKSFLEAVDNLQCQFFSEGVSSGKKAGGSFGKSITGARCDAGNYFSTAMRR